jgi:hypothetical protein
MCLHVVDLCSSIIMRVLVSMTSGGTGRAGARTCICSTTVVSVDSEINILRRILYVGLN